MKDRTVKILFWIIVIAGMALILSGCVQGEPGQSKLIIDPNFIADVFQLGYKAAQTGQAVGATTGNPYLYVGSTLVLLALGGIGKKLFEKKKKG